jgi:hypothetical protein
MTETVPLTLSRFAYHLKLYNHFAVLEERTPTPELTPEETAPPFTTLPKPSTTHSGDIDFGGGYCRKRKRLESRKRSDRGQGIMAIEQHLSENNIH